MMDSQETTLETGKSEEVMQAAESSAPATEVAEAETTTVNNQDDAPVEPAEAQQAATERKAYATKQEVLARVKEIAHGEETPGKEEMDYLKTVFYKLHNAEREAKLKAYIDEGGDPNAYQVVPDDDEEAFKAEMGIIKERRAKLFKQQEEEKADNLKRKLDIIEKIKGMAASPEEANKAYKDFKALQQEWKEIKDVPAAKANELWRNYQFYVEQFYDQLKLNIEAREYDFKKNLELKTHLCETVEKLAEDKDVVSAAHQLQKLHDEYREIGPVAKELRADIWARFKAASTVINKRHQQYFDNLRSKEADNLARKTALCERIEAVVAEENKNAADWEKRTKEVMEIQAEWKTIGFAPQKMNVKIFERFRAACDVFFARKADFFKKLKDDFKVNADRKRALIDRANEMKDSTDWKSTTDKFIALQKEWKTIGSVPKKLGDTLWEEFLEACNHFFEARNAANAGQRSEEKGNLEKKRAVIEKLKAIAENPGDDAHDEVKSLTEEYNSIGHVPFKDKEKLYTEYRAILDKIYKDLNISGARRRLSNFKNKLKNAASQGEGAFDNERARLFRQYEAIKSEVQTFENNIGFLNASSKKGNSLIEEMNRKVQKLKDEMALVREKIKAIDQQNNE